MVPTSTRSLARAKQLSAGIDVGVATKFLAFLVVLCFERCCPKQNTVVRWKSKYLAQKKFSGWLRYCPRACSKNNISMIGVFTLRNILIVNTKTIKGKLSKIFISEECIKLVALCINRHVRSSSQLQEADKLDMNLQSLCGNGVSLFAVRILAKPYHFGVSWPKFCKNKDMVHFFTLQFEWHNRYNKLLLCKSGNNDIAWCNKNN